MEELTLFLCHYIRGLMTIEKGTLLVIAENLISTMDSCSAARWKQTVPRKYHLEYVDQHGKHLVRAMENILKEYDTISEDTHKKIISLFEQAVLEKAEELKKEE